MRTVLIAHGDVAYSETLSNILRLGGYRVINCGGPWPPIERCIRCDKGYCPLTEGADLMIYDPQLTALDKEGRRYNLAVDSALAHPEVPMLLAWAPDRTPDLGVLRQIRQDVPTAHVAGHEPSALLRQVHDLLARTLTVITT